MSRENAATEASGARGAGCGCKLPPDFLTELIAGLPRGDDRRIIAGPEAFDDAAAFALDPDTALLGSLDFFTPIVADGATFGAIAATNAMSDIYAMGGTPIFALAIAAYPREDGPMGLGEILTGGAEAAASMGCPVLGGHSIDDPEIKYGLAVVGRASPDSLMRNDGGAEGDRLVLTKPLGTGIAVASGDPQLLEPAVASMLVPNAAAGEAAVAAGVRGATDVTGFGLIGHLHEIARASALSASLSLADIPLLPGVAEHARAGIAPGGAGRNRKALAGAALIAPGIADADATPLFDPQTSGGLLLCVPPAELDTLRAELSVRGVEGRVIGELHSGPPGAVHVTG